MLKEFFKNPFARFWLLFIEEQAQVFQNTVLKIEGDNITAIEVAKSVSELENTLRMRKKTNFYHRLQQPRKIN